MTTLCDKSAGECRVISTPCKAPTECSKARQDRYSERQESAEELSKRVNQRYLKIGQEIFSNFEGNQRNGMRQLNNAAVIA